MTVVTVVTVVKVVTVGTVVTVVNKKNFFSLKILFHAKKITTKKFHKNKFFTKKTSKSRCDETQIVMKLKTQIVRNLNSNCNEIQKLKL